MTFEFNVEHTIGDIAPQAIVEEELRQLARKSDYDAGDERRLQKSSFWRNTRIATLRENWRIGWAVAEGEIGVCPPLVLPARPIFCVGICEHAISLLHMF